jgi:hypothetical protein
MGFGTPPAGPRKPKRYGWHRRYHTDQWSERQMMPFWQLVADRSNAELCHVLCVKNWLDDCAGLAKKKGHIGEFNLHVCASGLKLKVETVTSIVRVLIDLQWLSRSHYITDWLDRQPPMEDQTAAERQRNKRRRDEALLRVMTGAGTQEDRDLLSKPVREAAAKLEKLSRVTKGEDVDDKPTPITPFIPVEPDDDRPITVALANETNQQIARAWLLGTGETVHTYGTACKIVAEAYVCTMMTADGIIRDWHEKDMERDAFALATIINGAFEQNMTGEAFRNVVKQRIDAWKTERNASLPLPFGPQVLRGGRD